jgi:endogenous inhibitor of DNA gyrase (YacG/DUF329 family)
MITACCPICERRMEGNTPTERRFLPFCSERCRRIDLGRWLGEGYRIPAPEAEDRPATDEDAEIVPPLAGRDLGRSQ